jgi:vacuolar protein sorting-associated protein 54
MSNEHQSVTAHQAEAAYNEEPLGRISSGSQNASTDAEIKKEGVSEEENARRQERQNALQEARDVLEVLGGPYHLDGFNLLGVVANPRAMSASTTVVTSSPSSFHGRYDTSASDTSSSLAEITSNLFGATGISYYHSLESTLSQVTVQMEDWSRYLMEDTETNEKPESQFELPEEYQSIDTSGLRAYLNQSGSKATTFANILANDAKELDNQNRSVRSLTPDDSDSIEFVDTTDIPAIFFCEDFDLTNPKTFRELLLCGDGSGNLDGSVYEWFPLLPQDALTAHEDKIELALLQQVRANSDKFFAESQRFAQLQEWIQSLLHQVFELQNITKHLKANLLQPLQIVPTADLQRADLRKLELILERADDMLLCKHGLGGVLSAQDDLTAIEQIQYGRRLLQGRLENDDDGTAELGRLYAFKAVAEQLNQYEQLVVSNLRDEMVEIFLSWTSHNAPMSTFSSGIATSRVSQQQMLQERLREIAGALKRCNALEKTKEVYGIRLQDVLRMTVRTTVAEFASDVAPSGAVQSVASSTTSMNLNRFLDCLDMLFEQMLALLGSAKSVDEFCIKENVWFDEEVIGKQAEKDHQNLQPTPVSNTPTTKETPFESVIIATSELSSKSISELLRLRKDAHTLITLDEMKAIWDSCTSFADNVEKVCGSGHTSVLRSTLMAQAKAFIERMHESNMSKLAAALDSERWIQCEVSSERQAGVTKLCTGRSVISSALKATDPENENGNDVAQKSQEIEAEGTRYKVVWSCLLLVEMILNNVATAAYFPNLSASIVGKVAELLRLFNSRTTQLILGAGAIHSHAKLKSINAKHLSLVTQCLGLVIALLPHIRAALMAQLPKKQHTLLGSLDQIRKEFGDHNEKVLNKFVSIIGGIVEHGLAKKIPGTDFDERAEASQQNGAVTCCVFLDGVSSNTQKMHQVLHSLLPPDHLKDTFSRIFAFIDTKVPTLFIAAANSQPVFQQNTSPNQNAPAKSQQEFSFPKTEEGKRQFLMEIDIMTNNLNSLEGVQPWDFTVRNAMERRLEIALDGGQLNGTEVDIGMSSKTTEEGRDSDETKLDSEPISEPVPESTVAEGYTAPESEVENVVEGALSNEHQEINESAEQPLQSPTTMDTTAIDSEQKSPMRNQSSTSMDNSNFIAGIEQNSIQ